MKKFVKFLGGEKGSTSYQSIWSMPAPESGTRVVVTNTKKPQTPLHTSSLKQPEVAELSSPTTSTSSALTGKDTIAELSGSTVTQVSELEAQDLRSSTAQDNVAEAERDEGDGQTGQKGKQRDNSTPTPTLTRTSKPKPKPKPKPKHPNSDLLIFSDTPDEIPLFGRQFGIAPTSILRDQEENESDQESETEAEEPEPELELQIKRTTTGPKSPEAFFQQVDEELEALYADYLKSSSKQKTPAQELAKKAKKWALKSKFGSGTSKASRSESSKASRSEACIICIEPFAPDGVRAPDTLSIACLHRPSVCYGCLEKSVKHDLETKFWDEIKCPECKTPLIYEDIKRFADKETFNRYNQMSLRNALNADKNFIWCLECDFGQLHEPGAEQPRVCCLNCNAESCFKHAIKWHDGFTCEEYDAVLWDPDSYNAIRAQNASGATESKFQRMSKRNMSRAKKKEQERQEKLHEGQKKAARKRQEEEATRMREAARLQQEKENEEKENEEARQEYIKDDFKDKIEMLKKRMREVELSVQRVEETTKRCPGCQWPIEKNDGCDHMTCIKCRHEFCWVCLGSWNPSRTWVGCTCKPS